MTPSTPTIFVCDSIGISGTTPVHCKVFEDGYWECRVGIAIMGATNMDASDFERCGHNPFHEDFHDNYASGTGATQAEALEALKQDKKELARSLW